MLHSDLEREVEESVFTGDVRKSEIKEEVVEECSENEEEIQHVLDDDEEDVIEPVITENEQDVVEVIQDPVVDRQATIVGLDPVTGVVDMWDEEEDEVEMDNKAEENDEMEEHNDRGDEKGDKRKEDNNVRKRRSSLCL